MCPRTQLSCGVPTLGAEEVMQRQKLPGSFRLKKESGVFMAEKGDRQVKGRAR